MNNRRFCEITLWWNWHYIKNQISPHFFYYPAKLMLKKGFYVEVLTKLYQERYERGYEVNNGINIRRFSKNPEKFCMNLLRYINKSDFSLIHLHTIGFLEDFIPWIISRIKNIPMIFTNHSHNSIHGILLNKNNKFKSSIIKGKLKILNSNSFFIAFTKFQANLYSSFGIKNIRIIPHGINNTIFNIDKNYKVVEKYRLNEKNILCVGNIDPRKGQHILIESMPEILKSYPRTKLFLVGRVFEKYQIEYLKLIESKIEKMGLKKNVAILNDITRDELIHLYLFTDIFAFPTDIEMFGIVFLEAMAAELPIISTDRPYIREILQDGDAGLLVKREQREFKNGIITLLDDKNLRKRLSKNGLIAVKEKYSLDKVVNQHWKLYKSLLDL